MREIEIFSEAPLDGDDETLRVYLDEACGDDESMKGRVRELLKADQAAGGGSFMEDPPFEVVSGTDQGDLASGTLVGHYKLLQRIGEGAFGSVFMAEQLEPVKRRVAVKIIKLGMDTRQVVARFEVERQALAMMDHPNIARVYDAGATEAGRPYFVMELVRGIPITQFCEEQKLNTEERLALFLEVCSAVQHAHQKGIIHRDLKPSNVMVTLHDDKPVPKVIDFGVAKATQQDLTQKTLFTRFEQFIGTPAYMSPEQAEMSGLDIDTRSDIYSLGVLLYELLTGTTPLNANRLSSIGQDEMRRVIREEEPPRPSTRRTLRQNRVNRDAREIIPPTRIDRDLDWIVMKALEKDRKRRYDTANGLAADVRRYLAHEPVEAGAPTLAYRFGKYVRRNRAVVITGGTVAASLATAAVVSTLFFFSEKKAREEAVTSESRAVRVSLIARHAEAEGLLASGKKRLGMAKLAQLIREDGNNLVAAERLLSALQRHDFTRVLHLFPNSQDAALGPDGSLLVTSTADETGLQVWDARTGDPVGKALPDLPGYQGRDFGFDVSFHPSEPWLLTDHRETSSEVSCLRIYNYETGTVVGSPVVLEGKTYFSRFSPSGRSLITGGSYRNSETRRNEAWVFDSATGEALFSIPGPVGRNALEGMFSPDESLVALIRDRRLTLCDAQSGAKLREIRHPSGLTIWDFAFSPDGRTIATASEDRTVRLWEVETGQLVGGPFFHAETVRALEFSQNGLLLASRSGNDWVHVWNVASGKLQFEPPIQVQGLLKAVHFHPKGHQLLTVDDRRIEIWDAASGKKVGDAVDRGLSFFGAQWSPTGNEILTFGLGGRSHLVKAPVATPPCQEFHHPASPDSTELNGLVTSANFHPAGTHLVSGGRDTRARVWDLTRGTQEREFYLASGVEWVDYSPDGSLLLATWGSPGGGVRVWDTGTWKPMGSPPESGYVGFATFVPPRDGGEGWEVLSAAGGSPPFLWNPGETTPPTFFETDLRLTKSMVDAVARSRDGRLVATLSSANEVLLWDALTGDLVRRLDGDFGQKGHSDYVRSVCFSADDTRILTTSNDHTARVWETATGRQLIWPPMKHGEEVTYGTFSPGDGKWIATASRDGTARLWDATTGEPVGVPMQHESWVNHVAFDPRGERIITASDDGMDRVWDAATGFPLSEPMEHDGQSRYATFGPSGNRAVTVGLDSKVRLWELPQFPKRKVPEWLAGWIEGVVGLRIDDSNRVVEVDHETPKGLEEWALEVAKGDDFYGRYVRWFYESPETRSISPFSEVTQAQFVQHRMQDRTLDVAPVLESLREVIRIAPAHRPAHLELARSLGTLQDGDPIGNLERARYHAQVALSLAPGDDEADDEEAGALLATIERRLMASDVESRCEALEKQAANLRDSGEGAAALILIRQAAFQRIALRLEEDAPLDALQSALQPLRTFLIDHDPSVPLVESGSVWRYLDAGQVLPPAGWTTPSYDDSGWPSGPAPLGHSRDGEDGEATPLLAGEGDDWRMAFYFRRRFEAAKLAREGKVGLLRLRRDDGAVVYLNGREVCRTNMPHGVIEPSTRALTTVATAQEKDVLFFRIEPEWIRDGENVLAVEVHQANQNSSDVMMDLGLDVITDPLQVLGREGGRDFLYQPSSSVRLAEGSPAELADRAKVQWLLRDLQAARESLDAGLERLAEKVKPREVRLRKGLLRLKYEMLLHEEELAEAEEVAKEISAIPPRDPALPTTMLDLGEIYTLGFFAPVSLVPGGGMDVLERLPETFDPGHGPGFDIRGFIQLNSGTFSDSPDQDPRDYNERNQASCPMRVTIPVNQKASKIHFLQSCRQGSVEVGTKVASYWIHYDDGTSRECPVTFGKDLTGFWIHNRPEDELAGVGHFAWKGKFGLANGTGTFGLARQVWSNPDDGKTITHLEFVSEGSRAAPFLVAVTLE